MIILGTLAALGIGYVIGTMQGGINININKGDPPITEADGTPKYNKPVEMPVDVQTYFDKTYGQIK